MHRGCLLVAFAFAMGLPVPAGAQDRAAQDSARIAELERRIEAIGRQIEEMRLGQDVAAEADTSLYGLAPAASKVYRVRQGVAIAGYGEMLYENFAAETEGNAPAGAKDELDLLRAVVYVGYKFNDQILFNSELEFEHGGEEVGVEFAYLDYILSPQLGIRAGLVLPPMGFINEVHEPPTFLGTTRPETERQIIPSTWRENGIGVFGQTPALAYRAYVVNGFRGDGFSASGLRGGRQNGSEALAENFGIVARLDYVGTLGLLVGGSAYFGNSGQGDTIGSGETVEAPTVIAEGHVQYRARGLDLRGLFAVATVKDVEALNELNSIAPGSDASIGERLVGGYVQAGYDVLSRAGTTHELIPYVRYETLNTQDEVPPGFSASAATERRIWSVGAAWKPIPNVAVKADYQIHSNEAKTGVNRFDVNVSYLF